MKKEKIIAISVFILLTLFFIGIFLYWDKFQNNNYDDLSHLNSVKEDINAFSLKKDLYNYQEEVSKILEKRQFSQFELDLYYSDQLKYDWFIYPDENIYCIDVWGSQQHYVDYKLYTFFKDGTFRENAKYYAWGYVNLAYAYIDGEELSWSSDLYKMLVSLNENEENLLYLYKNNNPIGFKKEMLKINNANGNHDSLTILFFQKHKLDTESIDPYLNQCFDYNNGWLLNETKVKSVLYKYLLKSE